MSTISLAIRNNPLPSLPRSTGVSEEAKTLQERLAEAISHLFESQTLGESLRENLGNLQEVVQEASNPNWDGYDALPVNQLTHYKASQFLTALPASIPNPEIGVDPDGEISFEWYHSPDNIFSVSVSQGGKLTYAGIFGLSKVHGVEYFEDKMPGAILNNLQRLWHEELNY
jgi:hypothetical protein